MDRVAVKGTLCLFSTLLNISATEAACLEHQQSLSISAVSLIAAAKSSTLDYSHYPLTYSYASGW